MSNQQVNKASDDHSDDRFDHHSKNGWSESTLFQAPRLNPARLDPARPNRQMPVVVCPGFNQAALTEGLVRSLPTFIRPHVVRSLPISPFDIYQWMSDTLGNPATQPPVVGIGFSAGVVGLAGALLLWQQSGGKVARLLAVDGWGVPVLGLSVIRISHDRFTHLTTLPLGAGDINFYADPAVDHLRLWGNPEQVMGRCVPWYQMAEDSGEQMSAQDFLRRSLIEAFADHAPES